LTFFFSVSHGWFYSRSLGYPMRDVSAIKGWAYNQRLTTKNDLYFNVGKGD